MWISEVGWGNDLGGMTWIDSPRAHADDRIDLPQLIEAGQRLDLPIWAVADDWPKGGRTNLYAGVRSGGRVWRTKVDSNLRVTG